MSDRSSVTGGGSGQPTRSLSKQQVRRPRCSLRSFNHPPNQRHTYLLPRCDNEIYRDYGCLASQTNKLTAYDGRRSSSGACGIRVCGCNYCSNARGRRRRRRVRIINRRFYEKRLAGQTSLTVRFVLRRLMNEPRQQCTHTEATKTILTDVPATNNKTYITLLLSLDRFLSHQLVRSPIRSIIDKFFSSRYILSYSSNTNTRVSEIQWEMV